MTTNWKAGNGKLYPKCKVNIDDENNSYRYQSRDSEEDDEKLGLEVLLWLKSDKNRHRKR